MVLVALVGVVCWIVWQNHRLAVEDEATLGLARAIGRGDVQSAERYLAEGADPNGWSGGFAEETGMRGILAYLPMRGTRRHEGEPVLIMAIGRGMTPIVKALLAAGADPNVRAPQEAAALFAAARQGDTAIVSLLLQRGLRVNVRDAYNATPLQVALAMNHTDAAHLLIQHGADLAAAEKDGVDVAMLAAAVGDMPTLEACVRAGVSFTVSDSRVRTALHYAAKCRDPSAARYLCAHGASLNAADATGMTPLHVACENVRSATGIALLELGANTRLTAANKMTPLLSLASNYLAPGKDAPALLDALAQHGADISARDKRGRTPLECAELNPNNAVVMGWLLDHGSAAPPTDAAGRTLLHRVAEYGKAEETVVLLRHGYRVDALDIANGTPLLGACRTVNLGSARALLAAGADPTIANKAGETPLRIARRLATDMPEWAKFVADAERRRAHTK